MLVFTSLLPLIGLLPYLTQAQPADFGNSVSIGSYGPEAPDIVWGGLVFKISNRGLGVRPVAGDDSFKLWEYLDEEDDNKWKALGNGENFTLRLGMNMGERTCRMGRTSNKIKGYRSEAHEGAYGPGFTFQSAPSYLDHCFKKDSGDLVYIACGEVSGEIEATCSDWDWSKMLAPTARA